MDRVELPHPDEGVEELPAAEAIVGVGFEQVHGQRSCALRRGNVQRSHGELARGALRGHREHGLEADRLGLLAEWDFRLTQGWDVRGHIRLRSPRGGHRSCRRETPGRQ
ncbi:hypothetical protein STIAU_1459, partial [Stigmatella aurantiaca DW4/3-1]